MRDLNEAQHRLVIRDALVVPELSTADLKSTETNTLSDHGFASISQLSAREALCITLNNHEPLHIFYLSSNADKANEIELFIRTMTNSQNYVVEYFEDNSNITIKKWVYCDKDSTLDYIALQNKPQERHYESKIEVIQEQNSHFNSTQFELGGSNTSENVLIRQMAEHCETKLVGLFVKNANQTCHINTTIEHHKKFGKSTEAFKGVAADKAQAFFAGKITVQEGADQTDSTQSNNNLLLSSAATIGTKPELEIYADDVKCAHGATVGQLDEKELFYLRSRGIPMKDAKSLLLHAFINDIVGAIQNPQLKNYINQLVNQKLETIEDELS